MELEIAINQFVANLQAKLDEYNAKHFPSQTKPTIAIEFGGKWCKLIKADNNSRSMYAFIALQNFATKELGAVTAGDIHKPATYKKPAKHARGNVLQEATWGCAGPYGIEYLKGPSFKF